MNKAHHKEFEEALIVACRTFKIVMKKNMRIYNRVPKSENMRPLKHILGE